MQSVSAPAPVPVGVVKVLEQSIPIEIAAVGTVEPSAIVQIKSQINGQLQSVHFAEGQNVNQGDLLLQIDPRPYQEALRQAEAALARDRAQLRQAEATSARDQAQARSAQVEADRYTELLKQGIASRSQHEQFSTGADVARESVRAAQASIESAKAAIESDTAAIERAKLDLNYCRITAPTSGRTGNLLVHPGNLIRASDVPLVIIHRLNPVFVTFSIPEKYLASLRNLSARSNLSVAVKAKGEANDPVKGKLVLVDNTVDSTTGTIRLKAEVPNSAAVLWPGQFVNVALSLGMTDNAKILPLEAVQSSQSGHYVYVVNANSTVEARVVRPGRSFERRIILEEGVKPGEVVVVDGHLRLAPGIRVRAVDAPTLNSKPK